MTDTQRRAVADAVLAFIERSDEVSDSDELRLTLELRRRGHPVRRFRYAISRGRVRTFVRSLAGAAKPRVNRLEGKPINPDGPR